MNILYEITTNIGKIATDTNNNDLDTEWQIKYNKEGRTSEPLVAENTDISRPSRL